ncbi:hypothetical protein OUZ56_009646 [Daphnia magna]|uniref:Uncharacterized protein n=1 Tax=Daphnia magna TaxID=35525 RepID=A0ABR0AGM3_9CRUS|nr:hypothetical protein OUZ56_009646 [Daphnia magna]
MSRRYFFDIFENTVFNTAHMGENGVYLINWFLHKTLQPQQTNLDTNEIFAFVENVQLQYRPRSDAELPRLNSDLRWQRCRCLFLAKAPHEQSTVMGPRGQIPQVGIQPWQLSIRSWSIRSL